MKNLPKISIVIPSYNKVEYVSKTLQSIVNQKYPSLQVIIQDGGSKDGTLEIIKKYTKRYPKIFSFESRRDKGQADAINKGFSKAKGEVLGYISADDVYEKGALLIVGKYFMEHPNASWLVGRGKVINGRGLETSKLITAFKNLLLYINSYTALLMINYIMQPSAFFRKKLYQTEGPLIGLNNFALEYDLWLKLGREKMPHVLNNYLSSFRLEKGGSALSVKFYKTILSEDYKITMKYTKNPVILMIHKIFNYGRMIMIK